MAPFKGGRGKKAPYESTMVRIPVPIKPLIELLAESFRHYVALNGLTEDACLQFMHAIKKASTGQSENGPVDKVIEALQQQDCDTATTQTSTFK